jgi:alpha-maltose-1-phosphate synthase
VKNVLLAHPGTQYSFRLAGELHRRNALEAFYTGLAFVTGGYVDRGWRVLPERWRRRLSNRRISGLPASRLHCRPMGELMALWELARGGDSQEVVHRRNERFQQSIPNRALSGAKAVIGFDTSSWVLVERCAKVGVPLLLDQSIGHPDSKLEIYERVKRRFPAWGEGVETRRPAVREAEEKEHQGASLVIAASSFTRRTLIENGVQPNKIRVNPYGVDCTKFSVGERSKARPFRFVFVGSINARKGVPLLLDAWRQLHALGAELWLVGPASRRVLQLIPDLPGLRYVGAVPHIELPGILKECDVFVFPSYFEGFGLVILEAMACGLPIVTTTATAGPDIITQGQEGWIMEPDNLERLVAIMRDCMANRATLPEMGQRARATAERFSWVSYGNRWIEILEEVCAN